MSLLLLFNQAGATTVLQDTADALSLAEALQLQAQTLLGEGLPFADVLTRVTTTELAEPLALADALTRQTLTALAESLAITESLRLEARKVVAETLPLGEALAAQLVHVQALADALGLATETLTRQAQRGTAETAPLAEALARVVLQGIGEALPIPEVLRRQITQAPTAEAMGLAEVLTALRVALQSLADTLTLGETLTTETVAAIAAGGDVPRIARRRPAPPIRALGSPLLLTLGGRALTGVRPAPALSLDPAGFAAQVEAALAARPTPDHARPPAAVDDEAVLVLLDVL